MFNSDNHCTMLSHFVSLVIRSTVKGDIAAVDNESEGQRHVDLECFFPTNRVTSLGSLGTELMVLTITVVPQITSVTTHFCLLPNSKGTRGTLVCWGNCPHRKKLFGKWKCLQTDLQLPMLVTGCYGDALGCNGIP